MMNRHPDLHALAIRAMIERGFLADIPSEARAEVSSKLNQHGAWVRISHPQVEGKIADHGRRVDVGDRVRVRRVFVDAERGFIDFELV